MNKEEILKLVESLNFPKEQFYILSSACLTLYGLRDKAKDLDLCITEELFEKIKEKYDLNDSKKNECNFYKLNDLVEVVVNKKEEFANKYDIKEGYQVQKLEIMRTDKAKRGLPKDLKDIANIDEYLKKKPSR